MLNNPNKKVTILTARKLAYPIRKFFKDEFGMDVYVVALVVTIQKINPIGLKNILRKDTPILHLWMIHLRTSERLIN